MTDWWWLAILFGLVALHLWLLHVRVSKLEKRAHLDDVRRMAEALAEADAEGMREYVPAHDDEVHVAARRWEGSAIDADDLAALKRMTARARDEDE